ncbi:MAG: adenosylcobinamide-GDP ribazoletransferase [Armatimonadota bacterium]
MKELLTAIGFLTIAPVPSSAHGGSLGRAVVWFPAVGALVGLALAGADWCGRTLWDPYVAAALMIAAGIVLTGGLHIDGLMDTADALFSRKSPERMLEIMRDARAGALGVAAGVAVLALKLAAFGHLAGEQHWRVIAITPVAGRLAIVVALGVFPYARESGTGAAFAAETRWGRAVTALAVAMVISFALLSLTGVVLVSAGIVVALLIGAYMSRRLGGLTGDVYGAINEVTEVVVLLAGGLAASAR